ncbi:hypothetical protein HY991_02120 [Candidatus Micrarchaeota archaeon]|nr:hypothetical protein [Candidatus Micrarchaeota archaeon]
MKKGYLSIITAVLVSFVIMAAVASVYSFSAYTQAELHEMEAKKTADRLQDAIPFLSSSVVDAVVDAAAEACCPAGNPNNPTDAINTKIKQYLDESNRTLSEDGFSVFYSGLSSFSNLDCGSSFNVQYSVYVVSPSGKAKKDFTQQNINIQFQQNVPQLKILFPAQDITLSNCG